MVDARAVVELYFASVQSGDAEAVTRLYADDAVVAHANSEVDQEVAGTDRIRWFYSDVVLPLNPKVSDLSFYVDGHSCAAKFSVAADGREPVESFDVFEVNDDGLITRMDAYVRGRAGPGAA